MRRGCSAGSRLSWSVHRAAAAAGAITLVDVTNNIYAVTNNITNNVTNITVGQMVNQFQNVAVSNTGNGATLTVSPNSVAGNRAG